MSATCSHPDAAALAYPSCVHCRAHVGVRERIPDEPAAAHAYRSWLGNRHIIYDDGPTRDMSRFTLYCGCGEEAEVSIFNDLRPAPQFVVDYLNALLPHVCECIVGEVLVDRDLTPDERAAYDEPPRPGIWVGDIGADGRALSQEETDALIRVRLVHHVDRREVRQLAPGSYMPVFHTLATRQRGGIDSDPMVRLLAYRAWGDRDRRWFARAMPSLVAPARD